MTLLSHFTSTMAQAPAGFPDGPIPAALVAKVNASVDANAAGLTAIFKNLHQHPEIAFTEKRTAAIVAKDLKALGFTVTDGIGKTGVVGVLKNGPGPTVWFRADMDSNSVRETTGLPYAATAKQRLADGSEIDVMHACGHDAHVTWLIGLAKTMVALKADWSGTLVVYAQPAEEVGLGAQAMVDDRLWERGFPKPDVAFGVHTAPGPVGVIASSPGVRMAGTDQLDITFNGVGGHGSAPEMTIDPVVMAAQAVLAYQTIISRNLDPQASAVLSVGAIAAGRDNNVIPETAVLKLNLRWFTPEVRESFHRQVLASRHCQKVLAISHSTRADAAWLSPIPTEDVVVAHPGPSQCLERHAHAGPVERRRNAILIVGTREPRKNGDFLVDWFLRTRLFSLATVLVTGFLMLVSLIASATLSWMSSQFLGRYQLPVFWLQSVNLFLSIAIITVRGIHSVSALKRSYSGSFVLKCGIAAALESPPAGDDAAAAQPEGLAAFAARPAHRQDREH